MTFEQWWATEAYKGPWTDLDKVCRAAWDAATYAASTRAGELPRPLHLLLRAATPDDGWTATQTGWTPSSKLPKDEERLF